ncbi:MAG: hypothetical protein K6C31_05155, partial [Bacteroidales bacterium]|nr:hypothetical protein [Bacteroidales bacterium]
GDIYWDEDNTLRQPFRLTVSGGISYSAGSFRVYLRGENLSGAEIPVFWFRSVGREFYQLSRPATITLGVDFSIIKQ